MNLKTRRIIYISLIVFFLIATPVILTYSLGYNFDWGKKSFVKTGSFYFKSYPVSADIFINGKKQGTTPLYIKRLLPKEYDVKISKNGFYPWEKELTVSSQIVTEARNIFLVPGKPKSETIDGNLTQGFLLSDYFLKNAERAKIEQAKATATSILKTDSYTISGNKIFYLQPIDHILYQADTSGLNKQQITLEPLLADIYKFSVSLNQKSILALSKSKRLYLLNPEKNVFKLVETGVKDADFSLDSKKLLFYTDSEIWVIYLEKIQIQPYKDANERELITRFAEKINSAIWYPEDNEHIIFTVGDTIKITELDGRDRRNTFDFLKMGQNFQPDTWDNPQLYYSEQDARYIGRTARYNLKKGLLYFINDSKLYNAQIKAPQPLIETGGWITFGK